MYKGQSKSNLTCPLFHAIDKLGAIPLIFVGIQVQNDGYQFPCLRYVATGSPHFPSHIGAKVQRRLLFISVCIGQHLWHQINTGLGTSKVFSTYHDIALTKG
jgi:hypothetical protein